MVSRVLTADDPIHCDTWSYVMYNKILIRQSVMTHVFFLSPIFTFLTPLFSSIYKPFLYGKHFELIKYFFNI